MDEWLRQNLVCPRDRKPLEDRENDLVCPDGHAYPVVDDIPVMLIAEGEHTHGYIAETLKAVEEFRTTGKPGIEAETPPKNGDVDPFVQSEIVHTCGHLYFPVLNKLKRYPIPEFRLPQSSGERLLDVGCNWGRWSIAAAKKGYRPVGVDPSLRAVRAAKRISKQLGVSANFVVGDARSLPFAAGCFDTGFSFGVFQHFSKANAKTSLKQIALCVKKGGRISVQMPNKYGVRSFYQQARRGFTEGEGFETRYWTPQELLDCFNETFGPTKLSVDCYFGLGIQKNDVDLLPVQYKAVVHSSEFLRSVSKTITPLANVADSLYLDSINQNTEAAGRNQA